METQYFISLDQGRSSQGPFQTERLRRLYAERNIAADFLMRPSENAEWRPLAEVAPDWAAARREADAATDAVMARSEAEAIAEEKRLLLKGLLYFLAGVFITVGSFIAAAGSPTGGTLFIAYGATFSGLILFLANLKSVLERRRKRKAQGRS